MGEYIGFRVYWGLLSENGKDNGNYYNIGVI